MPKSKEPLSEFFSLIWNRDRQREALALSHTVALDAVDRFGRTPLHHAAAQGRLEICRVLLERGAKVDVRSCDSHRDNRTPLHDAGVNSRVIELLLDAGADIEARDKWGFTPLHWAAQFDRNLACEKLIARRAELNANTLDGDTPLHRAAFNGSVKAARVLIAAGASPLALPGPPAKKNLSAFQMAITRDCHEFVTVMAREYGEDLAQRTASGITLIQLAGKNQPMKELLLSLISEMAVKNAIAESANELVVPARRPGSMGPI